MTSTRVARAADAKEVQDSHICATESAVLGCSCQHNCSLTVHRYHTATPRQRSVRRLTMRPASRVVVYTARRHTHAARPGGLGVLTVASMNKQSVNQWLLFLDWLQRNTVLYAVNRRVIAASHIGLLCFMNKCLSLIDFKQVMSVYAFNCVHRLYTCKYVI